MMGCSVSQARQLIHDRIATKFPNDTEEKYSWLIGRMGNVLTPGLSPRDVIDLARKAVNDTGTDPIKEAYDDEYKKVQYEPKAWPPNSEYLKLALNAWLSAHDGCEVKGAWGRNGKYVQIFGMYHGRHFGFIVITPKSASTALAGANEGFRFMQEYPDSFCCYIKEEKSHKKTWKKFDGRLAEFEADKGHIAVLDDEARVKWYAVASLVNQINNGNVNIYEASKSRTATIDDAGAFLRSIDLVPDIFTETTDRPESPTPAPLSVDTEKLRTALVNVLASSPMKILAADKALALLTGKKVDVTRNELMAFINDHKDVFRVYPSKSGSDVMIGLTGKA